MILMGGDVKKEDLPRVISSECVIDCNRDTLEIKLQTIAKISSCEKVLLHSDFRNINLSPEIGEKTMYYRDLDGLFLLLDREVSDEEKLHYSETVFKGVLEAFIDSDGTPVTMFELEAEEPEPDTDPYGVLDIVTPEVPELDITLEDVEFCEAPPIDEVLQSYETKEQINKAKSEIELKDVELQKLEQHNKEAKLRKEQKEIKEAGKKTPSLFRYLISILLTPLDWLSDVSKATLASIVVTICFYVGYCLLAEKPIDLQAGVHLYESLKALAIKVVSDIQSAM